MIKNNYKLISYLVMVSAVVVVSVLLAPKSELLSKTGTPSSSFGYKLPDKSSMNSSMPTSVTWHEPSFMEGKKK